MAFLSKSSDSKTNHAPANRSMVRLAALPLQAKLRMGRPNDAFEQEANRVADRVMGMSEAQVQRQTDEEEVQTQPLVSQITPLVQRQPEEEEETTQTLQRQEEEKETAQTLQRQEEEEEETAQTLQRQEEEEETAQTLQRQPEEEEETTQTLQRQEEEEETAQAKTFPGQTPRISANLESRIQSQRGGGQPLPESTRNFFEPRFGTNFSGVRVHTDAEANSLSREINARAFTVGRDIFVGSGQYNPYSSAGRHLLAHELTHTVQQGAVVRRQPVTISQHTPSPMVQGDWFGIRNKVEKYADKIPGYFLFKVILGKSPITKKEVPPTGINILRGVLTLIPVLGEQWFKQLKKTGAADKAGAWLDKEIKKLDIWRGINAVVEIVKKGLPYALSNLGLIQETIAATVSRVRRFIRNVSGKIKEFIIAGALKLAGSAGEKVLAVFKKAKDIFAKILDNPLLFIKNFLSAFAQGFSQFSKNILKHLKGGIFGWLLGSLSSAGVDIRIPKKFDLKSIFGLVAQVLGFTYEAIKLKLTKKLGPKANKLIELLEKYVGFVKELVTKGPIVLWEKVKQSLGNLKQMVFDKLKQWVVFQVIGKAVTKLLLMMNPAGALLAVAEAIYKVVMFFIDRWEQIKGLVVSIFGSIRDIAFGNLKKAVAYVEKVLATGLTLVISFMARYVGLGGIGKEVQKILKAIRKPIDKAMNWVIAWMVKKIRKLGRAIAQRGIPKDPKKRLHLGLRAAAAAVRRLPGNKVGKAIVVSVLAAIKIRYGFSLLIPELIKGRWWIKGQINPHDKVDTDKVGTQIESSSDKYTITRLLQIGNSPGAIEDQNKAESLKNSLKNLCKVNEVTDISKQKEILQKMRDTKGSKFEQQNPDRKWESFHGVINAIYVEEQEKAIETLRYLLLQHELYKSVAIFGLERGASLVADLLAKGTHITPTHIPKPTTTSEPLKQRKLQIDQLIEIIKNMMKSKTKEASVDIVIASAYLSGTETNTVRDRLRPLLAEFKNLTIKIGVLREILGQIKSVKKKKKKIKIKTRFKLELTEANRMQVVTYNIPYILGEDINYQILRDKNKDSQQPITVFRATDKEIAAYQLNPKGEGRARDIIIDLATGKLKGKLPGVL